MRDLVNNIDVVSSIDPDDYTASVDGAGVDLQGFEGACIAFLVGTVTDGTHVPKVEESDTGAWGGEENDVAAADLDGTLANLASDTNQRVGYKGSKQHVRAVNTVSGATTGAQVAAVVIRGHAHRAPVE
jgi:hypothetical protein